MVDQENISPVLEPAAAKKGLSLAVLQVLRRESDSAHPLHQKDILELLSGIYHMDADRKTLRLHIRLLLSMGYPIEHVRDGWYYEHEITEQELCLLIDSLPDSLSESNRQQLIHKLGSLSSRFFSPEKDHRSSPGSSELLLTMEVLQEAIRRGCCVSFCYGQYDIDKKLHLKTHHDGSPRQYVVSPYRVIISGGHCLLLGNTQPHESISHYRLDRIRGMKLMQDRQALPPEKVTDQLADMAAYLSQRPYMYADEPVTVRFLMDRKHVGDVLDWFGTEVRFTELEDSSMTEVSVQASPIAMKYWALQYGELCEVLAPASLRRELADIAGRMAERYQKPAQRPERKLQHRALFPDIPVNSKE